MTARCASVASAQLTISDVLYEIDAWQIISLVENDEVDSLMMFHIEGAPNPLASINAVWAQRSLDGWDADAWVGEDTASVVLWAVANLGLPDPNEAGLPWPIDDIHLDVLGDDREIEPVSM